MSHDSAMALWRGQLQGKGKEKGQGERRPAEWIQQCFPGRYTAAGGCSSSKGQGKGKEQDKEQQEAAAAAAGPWQAAAGPWQGDEIASYARREVEGVLAHVRERMDEMEDMKRKKRKTEKPVKNVVCGSAI